MTIHAATKRERLLADKLRALAVARIGSRATFDQAAALGLSPFGLERLLAEREWPLDLAFRVADCLDLPYVQTLLGWLVCAPSGEWVDPSELMWIGIGSRSDPYTVQGRLRGKNEPVTLATTWDLDEAVQEVDRWASMSRGCP